MALNQVGDSGPSVLMAGVPVCTTVSSLVAVVPNRTLHRWPWAAHIGAESTR